MSITCPCCKAGNDSGPNCRRCKADLTLLFTVETDRATSIQLMWQRIYEGRYLEALTALDRALELKKGDDLRQTRVLLLLLTRDFQSALASYHELSGR